MDATVEGAVRKISTLLVVDDALNVPRVFRAVAVERRLVHARSSAEALRALELEAIDMAVVDLWMPPDNGLALLLQINERHPHVPVVMMSGMWTTPTLQAAARAGSFYCVDKQDERWLDEVAALVETWEAGASPALKPTSLELPTLEDVRERYVRGLLAVCGGNVSATADVMGVQRSSLQRTLRTSRERQETRNTADSESLRAKLERVSLEKTRRR